MSFKKTNAVRALEQAGISYELFEYEVDDGKIDGISVAHKIGKDPEQVFKTLVTQSGSHHYYVFIIPSDQELDMKRAAAVAQEKNIEMLPGKELLNLTGYVHGGCSPIAMKKRFPTFIDETAVLYESICVSAGKIGQNLSISAEELKEFIQASFETLTKD